MKSVTLQRTKDGQISLKEGHRFGEVREMDLEEKIGERTREGGGEADLLVTHENIPSCR
jgi:hypothetical protein